MRILKYTYNNPDGSRIDLYFDKTDTESSGSIIRVGEIDGNPILVSIDDGTRNALSVHRNTAAPYRTNYTIAEYENEERIRVRISGSDGR